MTQNTASTSDHIQRVAIFTGSSMGANASFREGASAMASHLAASKIGVVYGGGHVGLMGVVADAALAAGGEVFGVIPDPLVSGEVAHTGLTSLEIVSDIHARKKRMAELSDAFIAFPGGVGTLEELFEAWAWQQMGIHQKPVALYDIDGYWQPLLRALDDMASHGFISKFTRSALIVHDDPQELLAAVRTWTPTVR
ncbi:LOG family protein [Arthrobacter psychrolactophilus]